VAIGSSSVLMIIMTGHTSGGKWYAETISNCPV
jgi:hypothetical protein